MGSCLTYVKKSQERGKVQSLNGLLEGRVGRREWDESVYGEAIHGIGFELEALRTHVSDTTLSLLDRDVRDICIPERTTASSASSSVDHGSDPHPPRQ
jgi:hypothetical protein